MLGLLSTTAKSSMRPPITAGPTSRNSRFLNLSVGLGWSPGAARAFIASTPRDTAQTRIGRRAFHVRFIFFSLCARPGMLLPLAGTAHQVFWKGKQPDAETDARSRRYVSPPENSAVAGSIPMQLAGYAC